MPLDSLDRWVSAPRKGELFDWPLGDERDQRDRTLNRHDDFAAGRRGEDQIVDVIQLIYSMVGEQTGVARNESALKDGDSGGGVAGSGDGGRAKDGACHLK